MNLKIGKENQQSKNRTAKEINKSDKSLWKGRKNKEGDRERDRERERMRIKKRQGETN
jgi:hypothetical protein